MEEELCVWVHMFHISVWFVFGAALCIHMRAHYSTQFWAIQVNLVSFSRYSEAIIIIKDLSWMIIRANSVALALAVVAQVLALTLTLLVLIVLLYWGMMMMRECKHEREQIQCVCA